jgi:methionyl-tRNA formyltransferase
MKIIFFGTSQFAAQILSYLRNQGQAIEAIVTRPDRPQGRSLHTSPPPVKQMAIKLNLNIPVYQPEKASTPEFAAILSSHKADLFVVVAFGEIIKTNLLSIPPRGCINIHASLLPKYRGAAPMQRCLMDGEEETGVTIIDMVLKMDAGDIIEALKIPVSEEMTFGEVEAKLCALSCTAISKAIHDIESGTAKKTPQNEALATYAPKITPEEQQIHWDLPARQMHNLIRALSPSPGAWCYIKVGDEQKRLKIKRSAVQQHMSGPPGTILSFGKEGWVVACGSQALRLLEVQLEGKKAMAAEDFIKGLHQPLSLNFFT